ncbi:MAG: hypothetical protein H6728_06860 [Myxococcales bacterium]|nr:hypothetical protein [Myxococcales bacterium]
MLLRRWGAWFLFVLFVLKGCTCQNQVTTETTTETKLQESFLPDDRPSEVGGVETASDVTDASPEKPAPKEEPISLENEAIAQEKVAELSSEMQVEVSPEPVLEIPAERPALPILRVDLVQWVKDWNYSSDGANRFRAISSSEQASFESMIRSFLQGDRAGVERQAPLFGMGLSRLQDTVDGKFYWLLAETASPGVGRGLYLRPEQPKRGFVLQSPHPIKDTATHTQGALLLRALQPQLLMIASLQRCDASQKTSCDGSTTQCGGAYRISDVAHFAESGFHLAHTVVSSVLSTALVLQLHGFAWSTGEPSAFVSNGTTKASTQGSYSLRLRDALVAVLQGSGLVAPQSCNDPNDKDTRLCGTNNLQGRHSNGSTAVCTQGASQATDRFLHIEQRKELRTGTPGPSVMEQALRQLFP